MAIVFGHEIHILILNFAKIQIFIPKSTEGGGGSTGLGNIPKKTFFWVLPLIGLLTKLSKKYWTHFRTSGHVFGQIMGL